jgi:glycosyltransferase involved in cell wall biosynthesis
MTDRKATIDILLATYNGEKFLAEQIASIFAQSHLQFRLLVRDDGSSDGTASLLGDCAARRPGEVVVIDNRGCRLGPSGSFGALLEHSTAGYVMFCDQDDVWLPEKVARLLGRMRAAEEKYGHQTPILVHSDLAVVGERLETIHPSFWRYQRLSPIRGAKLNRLLVQNVVAGCAAMINRALAERALPIPPEAVMHDWWLALTAAALGRLECLAEATVLYRQHGQNRIGAQRWLRYVLAQARALLAGRTADVLQHSQRQAAALLCRFGPSLRAEQRSVVEAYATLGDHGPLSRRLLIVRHGLYKAGWIRNVGLLAAI